MFSRMTVRVAKGLDPDAGNYNQTLAVITKSNSSAIHPVLKDIISRLLIILTVAERRRLFIMAALDLLMGLADVAFLVALLFIIKVYTGSGTGTIILNSFSAIIKQDPITITGIFLGLFIIKNVAGVWIMKDQHKYVFGVASRLSELNINNYYKDSYSGFVNVDSSFRVRHISNVPIEFSSYILTNFQQIIAQAVLIIFTVTAILLYHPVLFVLLLILMLPPVLLLGWFTRHRLKQVRTQIKQSSARVIQYLQEALAAYVEANIYKKAALFIKRYHQHQQQLNQNIASQQTLQGSSSRFIEVFALLGFFILVVVNKYYGDQDTIDVMTIGIFMAAAYKIIPGVVKILNSITQMRTYSFILDDLVAETKVNEHLLKPVDARISHISFNNVNFKFKDNKIIDDLNFELVAGDMAGLAGISGKGKTTVLNILLGFLKQDNGKVYFNNEPIDDIGRRSYWQRIAYVKQQAFFMNDTILNNIVLSEGLHDAARLDNALQISGLDALLKGYPEGINKHIKEQGKNISGGQRQRVALARALYHDHDVLILDEPFSELDELAEHDIFTRLKNSNTNGSIVLLITHNKASLNFCDKIISV